MLFTISKELAKELFTRERIPAIRFLRNTLGIVGICPDLRVCRDIVDRIQMGAVETNDLGEESFIVRIRE
ncbi:MAG: hypothetical protein ACYSW6_11230 [Planctomycetota bacterium]|jgi:hypothetical protein